MKKLLIFSIVAVLLTGIVFAQETNGQDIEGERSAETNVGRTSSSDANSGRTIEGFNAEINFGFPIHWTNGHHHYNEIDPSIKTEDKIVTASTSIGVGITFNFTNKIGMIFEADFFYGAELTGISNPTSDYISLSGGNIFFGPLFYLFNNNVFRLPLAFGYHMYTFSDSLWIPGLDEGSWVTREDLQLGIGASLGFQFHFESGMYFFSRTTVIFDFVRFHTVKGYVASTNTDLTWPPTIVLGIPIEEPPDVFNFLSWTVKPVIGIGMRF